MPGLFIIAAGAAVLLLIAAGRGRLLMAGGDAEPPEPVELDDGAQEQGQGAQGFDVAAILADFDPLRWIPQATNEDTMSDTAQADNMAAFLATIRNAEGTAGPNGYRTLFGGALFSDFADHPRRAARFTDKAGRRLWTSAAGAYQFMAVSPLPTGGTTLVNTWDRIAKRLGLADFTPQNQDRAAVELIREAGALDDVHAGRFDAAISKVRKVWASLPGAGYAQPEKSLSSLQAAYVAAGGTINQG